MSLLAELHTDLQGELTAFQRPLAGLGGAEKRNIGVEGGERKKQEGRKAPHFLALTHTQKHHKHSHYFHEF